MKNAPKESMILQKMYGKSSMKYDVYRKTFETFQMLKDIAKEITTSTKKQISKTNPQIAVEYTDMGEFEIRLKFAGDMLVIMMHTNVFEFPREHEVMRTSYVKQDPSRSYCGVIHMYNFLSDSFKYNRTNDVGYLVARLFVNKEEHYMVEGKRQIGLLYNNFVNETINRTALKKVLISAIVYCLDFDLLTPPYDAIKEVSVLEMLENSSNMSIKTGKRLGFRFQVDKDDFVKK